MVDVPFVDSLPSLLPRLPPLTTRYVMTLKESSGSVHPQSSSVFFSSHESHIFCHFMGYHFASYTEMQHPLICYLYILEAGIHTITHATIGLLSKLCNNQPVTLVMDCHRGNETLDSSSDWCGAWSIRNHACFEGGGKARVCVKRWKHGVLMQIWLKLPIPFLLS